MDDAETIAKRILEAALPGAKLEYRPEQSHGEYDFDLHYPNGEIGAVEVTASVDPIQKETSNAILDKKKGGSAIEAEKCKKTWLIFPNKGAKINRIREKADEYLSRLEQAGCERFSWLEAATSRLRERAGIQKYFPSVTPKCVQDIVYDLMIMNGSVIAADAPPKIIISLPGGGGTVGPSVAVDAAEMELWKKDNREKLGRAKGKECHLVVYIDQMNGRPWVSLTDSEPPHTSPNLPEEITEVWLIGYSGRQSEFTIWRASATDPWSKSLIVCPSGSSSGAAA